jgi:hypothetical protein
MKKELSVQWMKEQNDIYIYWASTLQVHRLSIYITIPWKFCSLFLILDSLISLSYFFPLGGRSMS